MPTMLGGRRLKVSTSAPLDLSTESDLAVGTKTDDVEDFLPTSMPIEPRAWWLMGFFSGCCGVVFADYPRGGSSRSIPF
jgi:hypothetical protein